MCLVEEWSKQLQNLCDVAMTQPQAAYIRGFKSKLTYFQRTIPNFGNYLRPLQELLETKFIPTLFGLDTPVSAHLLNVVLLPVKHGGLGLTNMVEESETQFAGSKSITCQHVDTIVKQCTQITTEQETTKKEAIKNHVRLKEELLKKKMSNEDSSLSKDLLQFTQRARDKGAGSWLTNLPLKRQGFDLSKDEFRDGLKLRYNVPISDLPSHCVCGDRFNTIHALSCEKGGFVSQRLDNVRDMFTVLLDKCCTNVQSEPHLSDLQGEAFNLRTANTSQGARLDIKARNFWRQGQDAFFDISVTHVTKISQLIQFSRNMRRKRKGNTIKE